MKGWLPGIRGGALLGLAWAIAWAPIAVMVGVLLVDPNNSMDEMWPVIGAYPGFLCGAIFFGLVRTVERERALDQLPLGRAALWGAVSGLLVGALPFMIGEPTSALPLWQLAGVFMGPMTLLSILSAVGSTFFFRYLARRGTPPRSVPTS